MIEVIKKHRSIRHYTEQPIDDATLNEILEAGIRASNTGNMQIYSIIITRDVETKKRLSPAHFNQPMICGAAAVLTFCADVNRMKHWCKVNNADAGFDNFETFISAAIDATIAAQNVALEAEAHGLGICYLGTTTYNPDQIIDALQLPKGVFPITTVTIGYPAEQPPLTERLPLEAIVHYETYHDYTDDDINRLHAEKEQLPQNQQFVRENNKQNLAQVFSEIRYPRSNNEHFSQVLLDALKRQGMI